MEEPFEQEPELEQDVEVAADVIEEPVAQEDVVLGLPPAVSAGTMVSALSFMQESELDQDQEAIAFEDGAEWIEKQDTGRSEDLPVEHVSYAETNGTHAVHEHASVRSTLSSC